VVREEDARPLTHISAAFLSAPIAGHGSPVEFTTNNFDLPMVDMAAEHRLLLERLLDQGQTVRVRIDVQNRFKSGSVESGNVIGELVGAQFPEQVIVIGAHLDSWDIGQGATDDGFGVAALLGAAEALVRSGGRPRRTIRFALFSGEEQAMLGSRAYVLQHRSELANHVAAVMMDNGNGPITSLIVNGREDLVPSVQQALPFLTTVGALNVSNSMFVFGDTLTFTLAGLPAIDFGQNSPDSQFAHHSSVDTLDKVKPDILARNAAAMAVFAYWLADRPERLGSPWPTEQTIQLMEKQKLVDLLKTMSLWPFEAVRAVP
jgi:carboxypeptidase Q